ncbi:MAG TPA: hypothetical protein VJR27_00190 [Candidatus Saccharimonadales bacterium]|nr:hypothetical protein [Candidatus Saccharimonadales bacterium]
MESKTRSAPTLPDHPAFTPPQVVHPIGRVFLGLFATLVIAGAAYAIYVFEHKRVVDLQAREKDLQSQVISLQNQVAAEKAGGN